MMFVGYASSFIRVIVVSPGFIRTEMARRIWENTTSTKTSSQMHVLGRLGEPKYAASLDNWLVNPENDWITGQVI